MQVSGKRYSKGIFILPKFYKFAILSGVHKVPKEDAAAAASGLVFQSGMENIPLTEVQQCHKEHGK